MTMGQRILAARQGAGMSQRELAEKCGITRNMLSVLEHDRAQPSLQTLRDLSGTLGRTAGWFLGEEDSAMSAFRAGEYRRCLELLADSPDRGWLECAALLRLTEEAIEGEKLPYARELLERLDAAFARDGLFAPEFERRAALARAMCGLNAVIPEDGTLLLKARTAMDQGRAEDALRYLQAMDDRDTRWEYLMGRCYFARNEHARAYEHLRRCPESKEVCALLEQCALALEDYKMAYYYAKQAGLSAN